MYRRDNTTAPQPEDFFDDPKLPIATGDENVEEELIDTLEELEEGELRERLTDVERRRYPVPCDRPTWILPPPPQARIHNIPDSQVPSHANISARARLFTMRPIYWWGYDAEDRAFVTKHKGGYHMRFYSIHDVMKLPRESLDRMVDRNMYNPTDYHLAKSLELHLRRNNKNEYANFSRKPGQRFDVWRKGNVRKIYSEAMNAAGWTFPLANYARKPVGSLEMVKRWRMDSLSTNLVIEFFEGKPDITLKEYDDLKQFELEDLRRLQRIGDVKIPRSRKELHAEGCYYKRTLERLIPMEETCMDLENDVTSKYTA